MTTEDKSPAASATPLRRKAADALRKALSAAGLNPARPNPHAALLKQPRGRLIALFALLLVGWAAWSWLAGAADSSSAGEPAAIPVSIAVASRADVPVYLEGLGTVQAFNTITVTTRVDGALQTVNFVEGQDVKAGDVLAQIDPRPFQAALDQATATKAKDQAQLADANLDLARFANLAAQDDISRQTYDTQRALVAQLIAQVGVDQAAIDAAAANLDYTTIKSPIDGRTGIRLVDAGNNVMAAANTAIVVVTQIHPISVIFTLPEEDLTLLSQVSGAGPLTVVALSRDETTVLDTGTVGVVDNEVLQATGTIRIKANFPNAKNRLWPGQFVNARLLLKTLRNVVTVPSTAVQRGANGLFAYVVTRDSTVETRPVKLNRFNSAQAVIDAGLKPGERVVSSGQYRLQDGARVQAAGAAAPVQTATSGAMP
ncbi:MAG: efflux RND transporter periplasmic adaptor subunit [Rhizomicrobium sp.]